MWWLVVIVILVLWWYFTRRVVPPNVTETYDLVDGYYKSNDTFAQYYQVQKKDDLGNFSVVVAKPTFDSNGIVTNSTQNIGLTTATFRDGVLVYGDLRGELREGQLVFEKVVWTKVRSLGDLLVGTWTDELGNKWRITKSTNGRVVVFNGAVYKQVRVDEGKLDMGGVSGTFELGQAASDKLRWNNGTTWTRSS
jgi:hypothetical protein